jgi:hypothetical protein
MKIPVSVMALANICEPEPSRYSLYGVKFWRVSDRGYAVATDGRRLVLVEFDTIDVGFPEGEAASAILHHSHLEAAIKLCRLLGADSANLLQGKEVAYLAAGGEDNRQSLARAPLASKFPRHRDVLEVPTRHSIGTMSFDLHLLAGTLKAMADAMGAPGEYTRCRVLLDIPETSGDSLIMRAEWEGGSPSHPSRPMRTTAIIMPRYDDTNPPQSFTKDSVADLKQEITQLRRENEELRARLEAARNECFEVNVL